MASATSRISPSHWVIALCAALVLLSLMAHLVGDTTGSAPAAHNGDPLSELALPGADGLFEPSPIVLLLAGADFGCLAWAPSPPVLPPLFA